MQFWINFPTFHKMLHGLATQHTIYDFLKQIKQNLYV